MNGKQANQEEEGVSEIYKKLTKVESLNAKNAMDAKKIAKRLRIAHSLLTIHYPYSSNN